MKGNHPIIVFIHILKTAGSTFHQILNAQYPPEKIYTVDGIHTYDSLNTFKGLTQEERDALGLIKGHCTLNIHEWLTAPYSYLTFLRNPFDAVFSQFYYIKRATHNRYHEKVKKMKSMEEFLDFVLEKNLNNLQTRHLSCAPEHIHKEGSRVDMDKKGNQIYEIALENVQKKIDHVLVTEDFDKALVYLKRKLEWNKPLAYTARNITHGRPGRDQIPPRIKERIEETEKFDIALYREAKKEFQNEIYREWDESMEEELMQLRSQKTVQKENPSFLKKLKRKVGSWMN